MSGRYEAIRAAFELLAATRLPRLIRKLSRSRGVILTLHRVVPEPPEEFSPNAILQVTPEFLEAAILGVRELGLDIVPLDEAIDRIVAPGAAGRKFVVFTFDDGYRDNLEHALPILRKHKCPFTLYVPTALVEARGEIWWQALEDIIAREDLIAIEQTGDRFQTRDLAGKQAAYAELYARMRAMPELARVALIRSMAARYRLDLRAHCRSLIMDWHELRIFADDPLCTIGAHTVHHYELAKLSAEDARSEIVLSRDILAGRLGKAPRHLSYPIGGRASAGPREYRMASDLGFRSAVTTLPGGLYHAHAEALTALPRVSLNGLFQAERYIDVFATGALFTLLGQLAERRPLRSRRALPSSG